MVIGCSSTGPGRGLAREDARIDGSDCRLRHDRPPDRSDDDLRCTPPTPRRPRRSTELSTAALLCSTSRAAAVDDLRTEADGPAGLRSGRSARRPRAAVRRPLAVGGSLCPRPSRLRVGCCGCDRSAAGPRRSFLDSLQQVPAAIAGAERRGPTAARRPCAARRARRLRRRARWRGRAVGGAKLVLQIARHVCAVPCQRGSQPAVLRPMG
jgi:hypothetical protein